MHYKKIILLLFILNLFSCKKDEIGVLKKGKWALEWSGQVNHKGTMHFKSNGRGTFLESITNIKYPFSYSVDGKSSTIKWENSNFSNSTQAFDIVLDQDKIQVWEEKNHASTFVLRK